MNNNLRLLDWITLISFGIGLYALYIALVNLDMNDEQSNELKQILHYLEEHLQEQDNHLLKQDELFINLSDHLEKQDKVLFDKQDII